MEINLSFVSMVLANYLSTLKANLSFIKTHTSKENFMSALNVMLNIENLLDLKFIKEHILDLNHLNAAFKTVENTLMKKEI